MAPITRMARITGRVTYVASSGEELVLPIGPCLLERGDGRMVDIFWGTTGQDSASVPRETLQTAEDAGHILLLG